MVRAACSPGCWGRDDPSPGTAGQQINQRSVRLLMGRGALTGITVIVAAPCRVSGLVIIACGRGEELDG